MIPLTTGQQLYRVGRWRNSESFAVSVMKIGRKWATISTDEKIDKITLSLQEGAGSVWLSKDHYELSLIREKAWQAFRKLMDHQYRIPDGVSVNQIENAARALLGKSVLTVPNPRVEQD
jgi:hypothetical protein